MTRTLPGARIALGAVVLLGCLTPKVDGPPSPPEFDPAYESERLGAPPEPVAAAPAARPLPLEMPTAPPVNEPAKEAQGQTEKPAAKPGGAPGEETPLGWIANEPLQAEEFLLEWVDGASRDFYLVLDKLVAARLALAEAQRIGIKLAPDAVEKRYAEERADLDAFVAKKSKTKSTDDYIVSELGLDPVRYLERMRRSTIRQMLAERAVRSASLSNESASVRMIVVKGEGVAAVQAALAEGKDFATVAREHSVDESKEQGGLVPFVVRQERSPLARLAFETPVGTVGGPVQLDEHSFFLRVEELRAPIEGDWSALESAVEASLAEHPVQEGEFLHWKLVMEKRYPIDLGPLWSLVGAAR